MEKKRKSKRKLKIRLDIGMAVLLLLLMSYELIGKAVHEWIGVVLFFLFALHHIVNGRRSRNLLKAPYTAPRVMQNISVVLLLFCVMGLMVSGVILSRHAFAFLSIHTGQSWARTTHLLCSYWGFVLMSLHLGFHWQEVIGVVKKHCAALPEAYFRVLRIAGTVFAGYGAAAFFRRDVGNYLLLKNEFVFFNHEEPIFWFFLDYMAIMGLFIFIGDCFMCVLRKQDN